MTTLGGLGLILLSHPDESKSENEIDLLTETEARQLKLDSSIHHSLVCSLAGCKKSAGLTVHMLATDTSLL